MNIEEQTPLHTSEWMKAYTSEESDIHSFYSYAPIHESSFFRRATELDQRERNSEAKEGVAQVMRAFHEPDLLHPAIERNLARFCMPESLVVIGGHQACLLTGPLYTIYKAITIIQLAAREEKRLGRPVIPVFWIAGEDHDWDEVNHIWVQDEEKNPLKMRFSPIQNNRKAVSNVTLNSGEMHSWLEELSEMLPDSHHKKEWMTILKGCTNETISWTRFFAKVMTHLFGKHGLLLIDAADPNLRKWEKPFWYKLIVRNREIQQQIEQTRLQVQATSIPHKPDFAHLFLGDQEGNRYPLYFNGQIWRAQGAHYQFTTQEMLDLANQFPERLSNNVLTRPLMQEYLFPTLAFVRGEAEIAYWGLLKDVFQRCDLTMPIIHPRIEMTLVSSTMGKRMRQFDLSLRDIFERGVERKGAWLSEQYSFDSGALLHQAKDNMNGIYQELLRRLEQETGINLMEFGRGDRNKIVRHLDYLQKHLEKGVRIKYQAGLRQWDELLHTMSPLHKPQERLYNIMQYWNGYGLDWIDELIGTSLLRSGTMSYVVHM